MVPRGLQVGGRRNVAVPQLALATRQRSNGDRPLLTCLSAFRSRVHMVALF